MCEQINANVSLGKCITGEIPQTMTSDVWLETLPLNAKNNAFFLASCVQWQIIIYWTLMNTFKWSRWFTNADLFCFLFNTWGEMEINFDF